MRGAAPHVSRHTYFAQLLTTSNSSCFVSRVRASSFVFCLLLLLQVSPLEVTARTSSTAGLDASSPPKPPIYLAQQFSANATVRDASPLGPDYMYLKLRYDPELGAVWQTLRDVRVPNPVTTTYVRRCRSNVTYFDDGKGRCSSEPTTAHQCPCATAFGETVGVKGSNLQLSPLTSCARYGPLFLPSFLPETARLVNTSTERINSVDTWHYSWLEPSVGSVVDGWVTAVPSTVASAKSGVSRVTGAPTRPALVRIVGGRVQTDYRDISFEHLPASAFDPPPQCVKRP